MQGLEFIPIFFDGQNCGYTNCTGTQVDIRISECHYGYSKQITKLGYKVSLTGLYGVTNKQGLAPR